MRTTSRHPHALLSAVLLAAGIVAGYLVGLARGPHELEHAAAHVEEAASCQEEYDGELSACRAANRSCVEIVRRLVEQNDGCRALVWLGAPRGKRLEREP
jgi:hypothetical protein